MTSDSLGILLAEDDDGHATLVRRSFRRAGLATDPIHLRDGQDVLDYVYQRGVWSGRASLDSVAMILDLNMPRLNGTEVLERLKADDVHARIPVFVLTTTDNPTELDRCYAMGAAACLVKPVEYGEFAEMMRRFAEFLMSAHLPGEVPPPHVR